MGNPLVSVVMATFNEPVEYIKASITSILGQTYSNLELIIADDSTNKETIAAIDHFRMKDNRVIIIRDEKRMGFVCALNKGLRLAKGEYIARMDGDDISDANRFYIQTDYLCSHKEIDILGGSMDIVDHNGKLVSHRSYPLKGFRLILWTILRNPLGHPTVMFRRKLVDSGFYYDESFLKAEDLEFWLRLRKAGFKIANIPKKLLNFRIVGDQAIKRTGDKLRFNYKARVKHLSVKYFVFDLLSIAIVKLYCVMPRKIISVAYSLENSSDAQTGEARAL